MTLGLRLLRGYVGGVAPPATWYAMTNGRATSSGAYAIGFATSTDYGATWTDSGSAVLSPGSGWEANHIKDPWLVWDGSQYVCYYAGDSGAFLTGTYQIGRATSPDRVTWTKYGSNPVIASGSGGDPDAGGASFPVVIYNASLSPAWRMWYRGWSSNSTELNTETVCYADSTDGISWTKRGRVLSFGSGADLDLNGLTPGCVLLNPDGSGRLFYTGYNASTGFMRSMTATFTDPAVSGSYTKEGVLAGLDATFTINGRTWRSNQPRGIIPYAGAYRTYLDLWNPSDLSAYEMCSVSTASSQLSWSTPSSQMFPIPGSGWIATAAENPSVILSP